MADNDKPARRSRLVQPVTLLIIAAVLVLALVVLFPARRFHALVLSTQQRERPSAVSANYLKALLRANPDDRDIRMNLAQQQVAAGKLAEAQKTLAPLRRSDESAVQWLWLQLDWKAFNAVAPGNPERAQRRGTLIAQLRAVEQKPELAPDRLEIIAKRWLALGEPAHAASLYERLATDDSENAYQWYARAGQWWLAAENPPRSARAWRQAFAQTDDVERRREAALAALDAVQRGSGGDNLDIARQFVEIYADDPTFLDIGIDIALANNRLHLAQRWSKRYLALRPDDEAAIQRDARIALAMDDLDDALAGLKKLVARNPSNVGLRAQLAQVQVWAGQPQAALASYRWLAHNAPGDAYDAQIISIAQDLQDMDAVLDALERIQRRHPLNAGQRRLLTDLLNSEGQPERAIAQLRSWLGRGTGDRDLWIRLATLQDQTGDTKGALASWQHIASGFGRALDETQARARLLVRLWRLEDALAVLRSLPDKPGAGNEQEIFYWNTSGELAWNLNEQAAARDAYYQLYLARELDPNGYLRLAQTAVQTQRLDMAMAVTRSDWRENRHADMIVQMLGAAQRLQRPDLTRELLAMSETHQDLFADSADYWQLYGDYQFAQRALDKARTAYRHALSIAPGDIGLRSALLYTLAESGRKRELRRYVRAWRADAWHEPRQWPTFAMAYSRLGETRRALPWFDRAVHDDPDNYLLVLDYADALERGRRFDSARRMREYALVKLRPRLMRDLRKRGLLTAGQREENARILGAQAAMLGPDASRSWLRQALKAHRGRKLEPVDIEMLLGYYLSQEEPAYARYWLLQAHRRRLATEDWQRLAVALQQNDQVAMQDILAHSDPDGDIGIADRITALRQLGYRERALTLGLDHTRPDEPYVTGSEAIPRYTAELYREMPQNFGAQLRTSGIGDLSSTSESVFFRLSGGRLSTRVEVGERQRDYDGGDVDLSGFEHERFASLELNWYERRGTSTVRIGTVAADAKDIIQLGLRQEWQLTRDLDGALFADYNALPDASGQLQALGVQDRFGASIDWTLDARDVASFTAAYSSYYSRENRNKLGDGYSLDASIAHSLMVGPTHQIQIRAFANTVRNSAVGDLPDDIAARLDDGSDPEDVVPERFTFIGTGVTLARGTPGSEYPVVGSPRYRIDLDTGYVMPDSQFGISANFSIGTSVLGSDEISFSLGVDQTGSDTQQNSYSGLLKYQYFLGR